MARQRFFARLSRTTVTQITAMEAPSRARVEQRPMPPEMLRAHVALSVIVMPSSPLNGLLIWVNRCGASDE